MSKRSKKAKSVDHNAVLEPEALFGKWRQRVEAGEIAVIAHDVQLYMMIQNHGPSTVWVLTSHGKDEKLVANAFRVMSVAGEVTVEITDGKCATFDVAFMPKPKSW